MEAPPRFHTAVAAVDAAGFAVSSPLLQLFVRDEPLAWWRRHPEGSTRAAAACRIGRVDRFSHRRCVHAGLVTTAAAQSLVSLAAPQECERAGLFSQPRAEG